VSYRTQVAQTPVTAALAAEAATLQEVISGLTETDLDQASPCPPWTVGELSCHVLIGANRIRQAMAEPEDAAARSSITTVQYFRADQRFSPAANADRIQTARAFAARLGGPSAIAAELGQRWAHAIELLTTAPSSQTFRTRHGDLMLLTDFARTRVVEVAVHGLDLAFGLKRQPWMTGAAADVLIELLLPGGHSDEFCERLNCDRVGLIARLTGRVRLRAADQQLLTESGVTWLTLG